jgi:uncharacterized protein (DUF1697 family)
MRSYVAFLRGINVGGHKPLRMDDVRRAFARLKYENVRTLLASGNILFEAPAGNERAVARSIEQTLRQALGMEIHVILRTPRSIGQLIAADPFRGIRVTPRTRLFVTFLAEKPASRLPIPYLSPDRSFHILCRHNLALCSVLTLGPQWGKNLRQMDILEKEFGKKITTRSWSTVLKIHAAGRTGQ